MNYTVSNLWQKFSPAAEQRLKTALQIATDNAVAEPTIFFRADDVAVPSRAFCELMGIFSRQKIPLALAVVPAWLTTTRWESLKKTASADPSLWCWHQHGWRHCNHEPTGRKAEFGSSRDRKALYTDLKAGRRRLEKEIGKEFSPIFTPPWNRIGMEGLKAVQSLGFLGLSRSLNAQPISLRGLPDIQVNVDLHTRKEKDPQLAWEHLFDEIESAFTKGPCGVMIHHQKMNRTAFEFLERMLILLKRERKIHLVPLIDLIG